MEKVHAPGLFRLDTRLPSLHVWSLMWRSVAVRMRPACQLKEIGSVSLTFGQDNVERPDRRLVQRTTKFIRPLIETREPVA